MEPHTEVEVIGYEYGCDFRVAASHVVVPLGVELGMPVLGKDCQPAQELHLHARVYVGSDAGIIGVGPVLLLSII